MESLEKKRKICSYYLLTDINADNNTLKKHLRKKNQKNTSLNPK